ncbi:MAG: acylphosphatase [Fidelibacterota bacterium]
MQSEEKSRVHLYVSGRVQGVFFRDFTRTHARKLGLTGWVRNLWDGRVEAVVEGEGDKIELLIKRVRIGPPASVVEGLQVEYEDYKGEFADFTIRW